MTRQKYVRRIKELARALAFADAERLRLRERVDELEREMWACGESHSIDAKFQAKFQEKWEGPDHGPGGWCNKCAQRHPLSPRHACACMCHANGAIVENNEHAHLIKGA